MTGGNVMTRSERAKRKQELYDEMVQKSRQLRQILKDKKVQQGFLEGERTEELQIAEEKIRR